jgi:hypothetical protein
MSDDTFARRRPPHIGATTQMAAARVAASTYGLDRAGAVSADECRLVDTLPFARGILRR